jgi:fumarate hydratase class II
MKPRGFRLEKDSMGEMKVPRQAYWGPETQRAYENFPISGLRFPREFIRALGIIKTASAETNIKLRLLNPNLGRAILRAAREVAEGKLDDHFVLDIFQTGSGTSTNMNANEVIAHRANEILGDKGGEKKPVHPNNHVNLGQSSNDVIPSAAHVSALEGIQKKLLPALNSLHLALEKKAGEFDSVIKIGRTHLQDATPIRLGQEFGGYASMVEHGRRRLETIRKHLAELPMGGTAVGTGINTHPRFARLVIREINEMTGLTFREADNHFEAQGSKDALVEASGGLKTAAVSLMKIANDIRWLGSGPRGGIGEIVILPVQPGSSIMPGKVNPVIAEALCQVCAQLMGNDLTVTVAGMSGNFELNVMMPVMAYNLLQSIHLLANTVGVFTEKCVKGLKADEKHCREMVEKSLAMVTALSPHIGHDLAAEIAREAYRTGKTIREIAMQRHVLPGKKLEKILDPWKMTEPGIEKP